MLLEFRSKLILYIGVQEHSVGEALRGLKSICCLCVWLSGRELHDYLFVLCKAGWENSRLLQHWAMQLELDELVTQRTKNCC